MKWLALLALSLLCCGFACNPRVGIAQHAVFLRWTGNPQAASYNIYRGAGCTALSSEFSSSSPFYTDTSVMPGQHYCYVVTAVSSDGIEGSYSNTAAINIRTP